MDFRRDIEHRIEDAEKILSLAHSILNPGDKGDEFVFRELLVDLIHWATVGDIDFETQFVVAREFCFCEHRFLVREEEGVDILDPDDSSPARRARRLQPDGRDAWNGGKARVRRQHVRGSITRPRSWSANRSAASPERNAGGDGEDHVGGDRDNV